MPKCNPGNRRCGKICLPCAKECHIGGKPCGDSFIAKYKQCHIPKSCPPPGMKLVAVRRKRTVYSLTE